MIGHSITPPEVKRQSFSSRLSVRLYNSTLGKKDQTQVERLDVKLHELIHYLCRRVGVPWLRGWRHRWRLGKCGPLFFVGKGVKLYFPRYLTVGDGVAIGDYSYLNCLSLQGVRIGDNVRLKEYVWLQVTSMLNDVGKGITIGENTYIGPNCLLGGAGGIQIGANCTFGAHVDLLAENHAFDRTDLPINQQGTVREGIVVGDDCWIGDRVIVLDGVTVGYGCVIGAGSVVTRDIPEYCIAVGNPARVVRKRSKS